MDSDAPLTPRQTEILGFIRSEIEAGAPPTYMEIAEHFDFHMNAALAHVKALVRHGYLSVRPAISRGIRLTDKAKKARS